MRLQRPASHLKHVPCSLGAGSGTTEERVFAESIVSLPTKCLDSERSHATFQIVFSSVSKHLGFFYTNSKFYKVVESLLWIKSYILEKDTTETHFQFFE